MTQGERLTRIETLLEGIDKKLDKLEVEQTKDIADLQALKNRGVGLLIGVGLAGSAVGALASKLWQAITG